MISDSLIRLTAALASHYRIERELGAGGMATVYLAHDLKHDRDVAIKVLHPDLGVALGGERFLTEIRTTARLQHPHILPLLDSGEADGLLYYVMPVVTGETLRAHLERVQQLPIPEAVRLAREVASALDYAHRQNVVHRDIKPENILLHDGSALVADFGIALAVQSAGGQRMTQTGLSLGTPQYMSPEQVDQRERLRDRQPALGRLGIAGGGFLKDQLRHVQRECVAARGPPRLGTLLTGGRDDGGRGPRGQIPEDGGFDIDGRQHLRNLPPRYWTATRSVEPHTAVPPNAQVQLQGHQ